MKNKRTIHSLWWKRNSERVGWTATLTLIALLLVGTVLLTPELRGQLLPTRIELNDMTANQPATDANTSPAAPDISSENTDNVQKSSTGAVPVLGKSAAVTVEAEIEDAAPSMSADSFNLSGLPGDVEILRGYGYGYNPNTEDYRFHRGYDLAAAESSSVSALVGGTVRESYEDAYWGGVVVLEHEGGWRTVYRCLLPTVTAGEQVEAGAMIGRITTTAAEAVQEAHYHVEVELNGTSVDPLELLDYPQ